MAAPTVTGLLDDAVVLVSGGTQGVGAATAAAAARAGASAVVVSGRHEDRAAAVLEAIAEAGASALFVRADVAVPEEATGSVERTVAEFGRIDALVNCAATVERGSLLDTTPELFDRHIAVNLRGPFLTMQAAVRDMLARGAPGTIVNVLTTSLHAGQPFLAPYTASKAGLAGLTKNVAHAHRFDRIRVNGLAIGWTLTEGEDAVQRAAHGAVDGWAEEAAARLPMGKLGQPDEIADMIVFLLSERSGVVTGAVIDWDQNVIGAVD